MCGWGTSVSEQSDEEKRTLDRLPKQSLSIFFSSTKTHAKNLFYSGGHRIWLQSLSSIHENKAVVGGLSKTDKNVNATDFVAHNISCRTRS